MAHFKKILALVLAVCVLVSVGVVSAVTVNAAAAEKAGEAVSASGITVHIYSE